MSYTTENTILRVLTANATAEAAQISELIEITTKYPAFGAAKYLLVKKMMQQSQPGFEKYAQDAVLYFPDPFWFHFKLNEEVLMENETFLQKKDGEKIAEQEKSASATNGTPFAEGHSEPVVAEALIEEAKPPQIVVEAETVKEDALNITAAEHPAEPGVAATEIAPPEPGPQHLQEAEETASPEELPATDAATITTQDERIRGQHEENAEAPAKGIAQREEISPTVETIAAHQEDKATVATAEQPEEELVIAAAEITPQELEPEHLRQEVETTAPEEETITVVAPAAAGGDAINEEQLEKAEIPAEGPAMEPAPREEPSTPVPEITAHAEPYVKTQIRFVFDESDVDGSDDDLQEEEAMPALQNERISAVLQDQLADFNKPVVEDAPVPVETEPYHTVDYFASQGIKLTLEQQTQDHLSVKVKKFTDWLKQMKRIAPVPTDLETDEAAERRVKTIAADSNQPKEVLTEAMAEVLVKQGMTDKAIEVYNKLSFLYPQKSAYFAAQIEQLKVI